MAKQVSIITRGRNLIVAGKVIKTYANNTQARKAKEAMQELAKLVSATQIWRDGTHTTDPKEMWWDLEAVKYTNRDRHLGYAPADPNTPNTCLLYTSPSPRDS